MPLRYETKITPEQRELFKSNAKQSNFIKIANIVATDYFDLSIDELGLYSTLLCLDSLKNFKDWFNTKLKYSGMCKGYFLKNYRNLKEKGLLLPNGKPNPDYLVDSMKWPTDQTGEIDKGYFVVSVDAILDLEMPHSAKGLYTAFCYAIPKTDTVVSAGFMLKICNITKNTFTKYFC